MSTEATTAVETALYRFFDADGALLYVGITNDVSTRWATHSKREFWQQVARADVEWFPTREKAMAAELAAIRDPDLRPVHNKAGFGRTRFSRPRQVGRTPHRTIRCDPALWDAAKARAEREDPSATISDVIRRLLEQYINDDKEQQR